MQAEVANGLLDNKHSRGTEYTLLKRGGESCEE